MIKDPVERAAWHKRLRRHQRAFYQGVFEPGTPDWIAREAVNTELAEQLASDTIGQAETYPITNRPKHISAEPSESGSRLPDTRRVIERSRRRAAPPVSIIPRDQRQPSALQITKSLSVVRKRAVRAERMKLGEANAIARKAAAARLAATPVDELSL